MELIPASAYKYIYLLIVTIITLVIYERYRTKMNWDYYVDSKRDVPAVILIIFLILFIGLRPVNGYYFVDMGNYASYYKYSEGNEFVFDWNVSNKLFDNLFAWWSSMYLGFTSLCVLFATIYFTTSYLGIRRLFPEHRFAAYLVFLAAFSTFSYGTNGMKAGMAASIFIWAMGYRDNWKVCVPLLFISWGFHHSMQLPVFAYVLTLFFKNPKWYYIGWAFCFLIALLHISFFQELFAGYTDERGVEYLTGGEGETIKTEVLGGFRIDFILYSAMPVLVGYYAEMKWNLPLSKLYGNLIHLYICINGVWMLCMYAEFTNRIAYLSWFLYPVVLIYPLLNEQWGQNKYVTFSKVMLLHLSFTLFMELIYYGGE